MVNIFKWNKYVAGIVLAVFISVQVLTVGSILLIPKPVKATYPNITMVDVWQTIEKILKGIAVRLATNIANRYLSAFVNKIIDKYKIKNFLYYDQILSNYYLTNLIRDKIRDPDLRQVYTLLNAAFVTGQPTGLSGQPPSNTALIPQIKQAIYKVYLARGGVPSETINNPQGHTTTNYYGAAALYYMNGPGYVERNLAGQFGAFQSEATTASQLEVIVGKGLKNGRIVGGRCSLLESRNIGTPTVATNTNINTSPQACQQAGGTWQPSALDQARSFIDNPTAFIEPWLHNTIGRIIDNNYDANNIWTQIGELLGNFLYNQLFLNDSRGVTLNEDPRAYVPTDGNALLGTPIDLDNDGITDGYDDTADGQPDRCVFGGAAGAPNVAGPPCQGSSQATAAPPEPGPCTGIPAAQNYEDDLQSAMDEVVATNPGGVADEPNTEDGSRAFLAEVVAVLQSRGLNASADVLNGNGNPNTGDLIAVWGPGEPMAERYDAVESVGAGDRSMADAITTQYVGTVSVAECT
jgi:hypothetical protein